MESTPALKQAVRVWLAQQGRTQDWLAAQLDVSASVLSRVLAGYSPLTDDLSTRLQRVTGINAVEIRASEVS